MNAGFGRIMHWWIHYFAFGNEEVGRGGYKKDMAADTPSGDYIPRCREVWFDDRDEALAAARQTAMSFLSGTVLESEHGKYITAKVGEYVVLIGRWKLSTNPPV